MPARPSQLVAAAHGVIDSKLKKFGEKNMKETVIFNGSDYFTKEACDEAAEFLKETNATENPDYDDCYIFQSERMNIDFDELKKSLSINIGREIIGLATVRVWNGYRKGAKRLSKNLSDILYIPSDSCIDDFSISMENDVESTAYHNDGYYEVIYRTVKPGVLEDTIHNAIMRWIYNGDDTRVMEITESLVPYVCKALGIVQEEKEAV